MKWKHPLVVAVVAGLLGVGQVAVASEPVDEVRQAVDTYIDHADPELTAAALVATAYVGSDEQREQLEVYKSATGEEERLAAAAALILTGEPGAVSFGAEQLLDARDTSQALLRLSTYVSESDLRRILEEALDEASNPQRREILYFMAAHRGPAYDALVDLVSSPDEEVRQVAMEALSYTATEQTLEVARQLSNSHNVDIRAQMLDITDGLSDRRELRSSLVEFLKGVVDDSDADIRQRAARQLISLDEDRGVEVLSEELAGADSDDRVEILEFLLSHDATADLETIRPLIEEVELGDEDETNRQRERELLYEFAATDVDNTLLGELNDKMSSTNFDERRIALRSLGRTGLPEARELLTQSLGEGRSDVRRFSARGLGQIADPASLSDLRSQLTGERDDEVRLELIWAIGQIRDVRSAQILQFLQNDRSSDIRMALVEALANIGLPESVSGLENVFHQRDAQLQWKTFVTLLSLDVDTARGLARQALRSPPDRFGHDLNPHGINERAREMVYGAILSHNANRVRSVGVNHVKANRDVMLPIAREVVVDGDVHEDTRAELVYLIATESDDDDRELFERVARNFSDEPGGLMAAWILIADLHEDSKEVFEQLAEAQEDTPMAIISRVALAKME